ncbi:hypothetical protein [Pantoea anthophila]|uniref:hypothetical protein n=1 Tax=Pantoea anthophila TaxID=470931 RepID=UPI00301C5EEF
MKDMSPLDSWLNVETWHTLHPKDDERFYKAIHKLMLINDPSPEPEQVRDYVLKLKTGQFQEDYLERTVSRYVGQYEAVFSFIYENRIKL